MGRKPEPRPFDEAAVAAGPKRATITRGRTVTLHLPRSDDQAHVYGLPTRYDQIATLEDLEAFSAACREHFGHTRAALTIHDYGLAAAERA